ncbi:cofilin-1-like [Arvicola amphibius]|uniref:cofilin-1-like n=1 Tax=Arvicola amphibius TaxID=1047088 RepID=UPI001C08CDA6|nr:cofilin-1-like [Arvicola amphibius]
MASGMTVSDGGIRAFNDMKVFKSSVPGEAKCKETKLFCLRGDKRNSILQEGKGILVGDGAHVGTTTFVKMLPDKGCCNPLCDVIQARRARRKGAWRSTSGPPRERALKSNGIYASPTEAIRKKMTDQE